ncbi:MAG: hypothetical protein ACI8P0_004847, partial [Planctomycetaceae bacterium]
VGQIQSGVTAGSETTTGACADDVRVATPPRITTTVTAANKVENRGEVRIDELPKAVRLTTA